MSVKKEKGIVLRIKYKNMNINFLTKSEIQDNIYKILKRK